MNRSMNIADRCFGICSRHPRRGSLIVEVALSSLLLMVAMSLTVRVLGWVGHERRAVERRQRAVLEVANAMERITAYEYDKVTSGLTQKLALESSLATSLPDAEWNTAVLETKPGSIPISKRVSLSLRWKNPQGNWDAPVRLTTWIARRSSKP